MLFFSNTYGFPNERRSLKALGSGDFCKSRIEFSPFEMFTGGRLFEIFRRAGYDSSGKGCLN